MRSLIQERIWGEKSNIVVLAGLITGTGHRKTARGWGDGMWGRDQGIYYFPAAAVNVHMQIQTCFMLSS